MNMVDGRVRSTCSPSGPLSRSSTWMPPLTWNDMYIPVEIRTNSSSIFFVDCPDWMSISSGILFVPFVPLRMWSHETSFFLHIYCATMAFYVQWISTYVEQWFHYVSTSPLCRRFSASLPYFAWASALCVHALWMRVLLNGSEGLVSSCL